MNYSQKILSQTIVELCSEKGIDHVVISPGSRNAPLTLGFGSHPEIHSFSVVDERSAAFFALGIAQQLKRPVAVVCTSGSALLNYYPAVAEAFYSDIPLVVISADRPADYIDIGDGQTIRQENVFANHILYSAHCKEGTAHQLDNETELNIALNTAIELNGPVHINVPFSEPLYQTTEQKLVWPQNVPPRISDNYIEEDLSAYAEKWNSSSKIMVLVGVLPPNSLERRFIDFLAENNRVLVLTETTSNLHHPNFISSIDTLIAPLSEEEFIDLQPNVLLTFGGMVVSKKIKAFLRTFPPQVHWHVDPKKAYDTFFVLDHHFKASVNSFFEKFIPLLHNNSSSSYQSIWRQVMQYRRERQNLFETQIPYSDFMVFCDVIKNLPPNIQLQLSNSATIRYSQLFDMPPSVQVFCNRGTSGIDGSSSTAVGAACASPLETLLVTGDLSFFYDSNALWNNYIPATFKIIVVNNQGGGIFRILPGDKHSDLFATYFETKHQLSAKKLCEMYGFQYSSVSTSEELKNTIIEFYKQEEGPVVLEIFTPPSVNDEVLIEYFKFIS